jgi:long-chain acyl-CoA synthetase
MHRSASHRIADGKATNPVTILDCIRDRARTQPGHPALLVDDGAGASEVHRYDALVARADAHAARFTAAGLRRGDRCGLLAPQGPEFIELALGILAAGGCLVPIPEDHRGPVFAAFARQAHLHHVVDATLDGGALRSLPDAGAVDGAGDEHFRALDPAYLRFTSGTTSQRKGVILGHAAILARLSAANRALAIGPGDRVLWLLPMAHHFVVSILLYLREGATILLPSGSLARTVLDFANREHATVFYASPYHYRLLGKDPSDAGLPRVRLAISTAEGLHASVAEAFRQRFGFPLSQALGIIEVGLPVANLRAAATKPTCLGQPLPDYDVWLRDDDGRRLDGPTSPERTGEICIRGPGLLDAYLEPWLPAADWLVPDGFRTGDQGWFDADGDLHLAGRRATRISMAGMKFFGEEVEAVLATHPGLRACRVFAREHPHLGEIPVAEIVPEDASSPPTRKELGDHCRALLPGYKVPREFRIVDALPLTPTGKLRRAPEDPPPR